MSEVNWEVVAARRVRLFWLGIVIGLVAGVLFGLWVSQPPVWLDELEVVYP